MDTKDKVLGTIWLSIIILGIYLVYEIGQWVFSSIWTFLISLVIGGIISVISLMFILEKGASRY